MNIRLIVLFCLVVGLGLGFGLAHVMNVENQNVGAELQQSSSNEPEILYWVAPMDSNFRRDKPGKSPMGMDLVPVYADGQAAKGVVSISAEVENSIGVRTEAVRFEPLTRTIRTSGYVAFDQDKLFHVYPRVEGWIEQLWVSAIGDKIEKSQRLFSIYSPTLVNAQEEYLAALKRNNAAIVRSSYNRLLALGISKDQIEQIKRQRKALQKVVIYAEHAGFLTEQNLRQGQYIEPKNKLMSIADTSSIWLKTEVFERQAVGIKEQMQATMTVDAITGRTWQGKVVHIHPFLLAQTRTLRLRLHFDNSDQQLKPNMFARIQLDVGSEQAVLSVPRQAVIRTGRQDRVVLALGDGKFRSVAVDIGIEANGYVEIIKGLSKDDVVVTSAQFLLDSESNIEGEFERMEVAEPLDHSQMDHSQMNHSDMDHSKMDHSQMNHGDMDHSQMNHGDMDHSQMDHSQMDHSKMNDDEDHGGQH